eukprot:2679302-Amphidinium_carterae.1
MPVRAAPIDYDIDVSNQFFARCGPYFSSFGCDFVRSLLLVVLNATIMYNNEGFQDPSIQIYDEPSSSFGLFCHSMSLSKYH